MKKLLIIILLLAAFLRLWNLGITPPSLHADEADTGYTAFSILKLGHDPYTDHLTPFYFRGQASIYRAPVYTFLVMPSIAVFGVTPFAVRFPSALLGIGVVFLVYLLTRKLFEKEKIAIIAAFLSAINPWAIQVSRSGLEVGPVLFFLLLGVVFYLSLSKEKIYYLYLSMIFFGVSIFTYHSAKIFAPLLILLLLWYKKEYFKKIKKHILVALLLFGIIYGVMFYYNAFGKGGAEYYNVSILNESRAKQTVDRERTLSNAPVSVSQVFHNKVFYFLKTFESHYFEPLSINYLFLNGESSLDKGVAKHGQYYLFELPFFLLGWYFLASKRKKEFVFLLLWFLTALLPGAITITGYYVYRDIQLLPVPILITSFGLYYGGSIVMKKISKKIVLLVLFLIALPFIASYLFTYFFDYPVYARNWWGYDQKQVLAYVEENKNNYNSVYIHSGEDWPVLYSFYNKIDPHVLYSAIREPVKFDGHTLTKIGTIYFGNVIGENHDIINPAIPKKSLIIVPGDVYTTYTPLNSFRDPDGVHVTINAFEVD